MALGRNLHQEQDIVWERLEKTLVYDPWLRTYPATWVECLIVVASYHSPLVVDTQKNIPSRHKPKRFELFWLTKQRSCQLIQQTWNMSFA